MYSIPHQQPVQVRAVLFTSVITGVCIVIFAFVTLYNPPVVLQEETVLLDLTMAPVPESSTEMPDNAALRSQAAGQTTGFSQQNIHSESKSPQNLPSNTEAMFPGMHSDEEGTGKEGNTEPHRGEPGKDEIPGYKDEGGHDLYLLNGRDCVFKPVMSAEIPEEGKVDVEIWVNEKGQVTRTRVNEQNTNTNSPLLRKLAVQNALHTKWSEKNGSPEQRGHISYKFVLR